MLIENHGNNSYTVDGIEITVWDHGILVGGTSRHRLAIKPFYAPTLAESIDKALAHYRKASIKQALNAFAAYKAA
jgi:hypothetical protein